MGMAVSIDVRDPDCPPSAIEEVIAWLHHVDDTFSTHKTDSPISAIGRGEVSFSETTEEVRDVLRLCETAHRDTGGAFDAFQVPAPNGTSFDPSGLVKGWSIERSAEILEVAGCADFCLNAGGDIAIRGHAAPGEPWQVGIRHPVDAEAVALVLVAEGRLAIATSATYERGAHIVDPSTRQPTTALASATVVGPDLTLADAYATAAFVKGCDALDWISDRPGYEAYLITHDDETCWSDGFTRYRAEGPRGAQSSGSRGSRGRPLPP